MKETKLEDADMVQITRKEYESLLQQSAWLECLECAGVDNWSGIDYAYELKQEQEAELPAKKRSK